jgi:hypothetical protein
MFRFFIGQSSSNYFRRHFHRKVKVHSPIVTNQKKVPSYEINFLGMPVPKSTAKLQRATGSYGVFHPLACVLGLPSRMGLTLGKEAELTYEKVFAHMSPKNNNNYFFSMSTSETVVNTFLNNNEVKIAGVKKTRIDINISHSPGFYVDTARTLYQETPDFAADDHIPDEQEHFNQHMLFSCVERIECEGVFVNNPFYIAVPENNPDLNEEYEIIYEDYCYLLNNIYNNVQEEILITNLNAFFDRLVSFYEKNLGKENNPFNLTITEFSKKHPEFFSQLTKKDNEDGLKLFLTDNANETTLLSAYRDSLHDLLKSHAYFTAKNNEEAVTDNAKNARPDF